MILSKTIGNYIGYKFKYPIICLHVYTRIFWVQPIPLINHLHSNLAYASCTHVSIVICQLSILKSIHLRIKIEKQIRKKTELKIKNYYKITKLNHLCNATHYTTAVLFSVKRIDVFLLLVATLFRVKNFISYFLWIIQIDHCGNPLKKKKKTVRHYSLSV